MTMSLYIAGLLAAYKRNYFLQLNNGSHDIALNEV
jgi:hypothetical protein